MACSLPALILSTTPGFCAMASCTAVVRAPSSETTASERTSTTSRGEPSPAATKPSTCLAILSLMVLSAISASTSTTSAGDPSSMISSRPGWPDGDLAHPPLAGRGGVAPASMVSAISSSTPALTTSRTPRPRSPVGFRRCGARRRLGSWARSSSIPSVVVTIEPGPVPEVAVVVRVRLRPARGGGPGVPCQWRVSCVMVPPALRTAAWRWISKVTAWATARWSSRSSSP